MKLALTNYRIQNFLLILLVFAAFSCGIKQPKEAPQPSPEVVEISEDAPTADPAKKPVYDLIKRIVPTVAEHFVVEFIQKEGEKDVYEVESKGDKIILRGNNGVSVASALNHYLKYYTNSSITWNGSNINVAYPLPVVPEKVRNTSPYKYR